MTRPLEIASTVGKRTAEGAIAGSVLNIASAVTSVIMHNDLYAKDPKTATIIFAALGSAYGLAYGLGEAREKVKGAVQNIKKTFYKSAAVTAGIADVAVAGLTVKSLHEGVPQDPSGIGVALVVLGICGALNGLIYGLGRTREKRRASSDPNLPFII